SESIPPCPASPPGKCFESSALDLSPERFSSRPRRPSEASSEISKVCSSVSSSPLVSFADSRCRRSFASSGPRAFRQLSSVALTAFGAPDERHYVAAESNYLFYLRPSGNDELGDANLLVGEKRLREFVRRPQQRCPNRAVVRHKTRPQPSIQ